MAKQKLNKQEKIAIINSITLKAFRPRYEALVKASNALADQVYDQQFGKAEAAVIRALKSRKAAIELIGEVSAVNVSIDPGNHHKELTISGVMGLKEGRYDKYVFPRHKTFSLKQSRVRFVSPASGRYETLKLVPTGDLLAVVQEHQKQSNAFCDEVIAFQNDVYSVVMGCSTAERLIELVPEAKPFIPKPAGPLATALVPVDTVQRVRQTIAGAASK